MRILAEREDVSSYRLDICSLTGLSYAAPERDQDVAKLIKKPYRHRRLIVERYSTSFSLSPGIHSLLGGTMDIYIPVARQTPLALTQTLGIWYSYRYHRSFFPAPFVSISQVSRFRDDLS